MKRPFQFCSSLTAILFFLLSLAGCADHHEPFNEEPEQDTLFVFEVESIDSVYFRDELKYEIRAALEEDSIKFRDSIYIPGFRKYHHRRDTLVVKKYPQGVTLTVTGDSLKDTIVLKADKAVYRSVEGRFEFKGNVRMTSTKYSMFTEHLTFTEWHHEYKTEDSVRVISPEAELIGKGFNTNETFSSYTIRGMKGYYKLPKK